MKNRIVKCSVKADFNEENKNRLEECKQRCGKLVSTFVEKLNSEIQDPYKGYSLFLNRVNEEKDFLIINNNLWRKYQDNIHGIPYTLYTSYYLDDYDKLKIYNSLCVNERLKKIIIP